MHVQTYVTARSPIVITMTRLDWTMRWSKVAKVDIPKLPKLWPPFVVMPKSLLEITPFMIPANSDVLYYLLGGGGVLSAFSPLSAATPVGRPHTGDTFEALSSLTHFPPLQQRRRIQSSFLQRLFSEGKRKKREVYTIQAAAETLLCIGERALNKPLQEAVLPWS